MYRLLEQSRFTTIVEVARAMPPDPQGQPWLENTVYRWFENGRVPKPAAREAVATALGVPVDHIPNGATGQRHGGLWTLFPRFEDVDDSTWLRLLDRADAWGAQVDIWAGTGLVLIEQIPFFVERLRLLSADHGTPIRVMLGDPTSDHAIRRGNEESLTAGEWGGDQFVERLEVGISKWRLALDGLDRAELRLYRAPYYRSIYRFGREMLSSNHLFGAPGTNSQSMHIDDSCVLWDGLTAEFDRLWETAVPQD